MQAEASQVTASAQLPEAQEQALDEYPMPDEQVSTPDMQEYGYSYDGMLPVTRERGIHPVPAPVPPATGKKQSSDWSLPAFADRPLPARSQSWT